MEHNTSWFVFNFLIGSGVGIFICFGGVFFFALVRKLMDKML
ncbi:hypothetical protein [Peribacillus glennii]|nr:hypothetical protein [Peribacillus glennii]